MTDDGQGALDVLRRGVAASPELKVGLRFTVFAAVASAVGKVSLPILVQQIVDRGLNGPDGFDATLVVALSAVGIAVALVVTVLQAITQLRLVEVSQRALYGLRSRAFAQIHRLSVADHNESQRGVWVSRVTSDIETLARFAQWGAVAWVVQGLLVIGVLIVLAVYSWQLMVVTLVAFAPVIPLLRFMQRRQLAAYDEQRTRVGETLSEFSETVGGAAVIRAYGLTERTQAKLEDRIDAQYRSEMRAGKFFALMFPLSDIFASLAVAAVVVAGVVWGVDWGLDVGSMIAVVFLVSLLLGPVAELSEVLDQTQTALAGWRKVLDLLDRPVEVVEPVDGQPLAAGPLAVEARSVYFAYRGGEPVLRDISVDIRPGANVAIVGMTGSGKTTFARLLARLADPTAGELLVGGVPLTAVDTAARHASVRMVPQDGFLFDTTVRENVRYGRPRAGDHHVEGAFEELGLWWWVERLPIGLDTPVGERGEALSVGERQLIALARAQLADPGLLILDEATAAVDPQTERALGQALVRVSRGRTTISIAHRLSTAQAADEVMVFDDGRIVEHGTHLDLVAHGGVYARLYASWIGGTRTDG